MFFVIRATEMRQCAGLLFLVLAVNAHMHFFPASHVLFSSTPETVDYHLSLFESTPSEAELPVWACSASTLTCTHVPRALLINQTTGNPYEPAEQLVLPSAPYRYYASAAITQPPNHCPLSFTRGRALDLEDSQQVEMLRAYGTVPDSPHAALEWRDCAEHRMGITPFRHLSSGQSGLYVKVYAPNVDAVFLTGSFNLQHDQPASERGWLHPADTSVPLDRHIRLSPALDRSGQTVLDDHFHAVLFLDDTAALEGAMYQIVVRASNPFEMEETGEVRAIYLHQFVPLETHAETVPCPYAGAQDALAQSTLDVGIVSLAPPTEFLEEAAEEAQWSAPLLRESPTRAKGGIYRIHAPTFVSTEGLTLTDNLLTRTAAALEAAIVALRDWGITEVQLSAASYLHIDADRNDRSPVRMSAGSLRAFVRRCHALGLGVLLEAGEKAAVMATQGSLAGARAFAVNASLASVPTSTRFEPYLRRFGEAVALGRDNILDTSPRFTNTRFLMQWHDLLMLGYHADGVVSDFLEWQGGTVLAVEYVDEATGTTMTVTRTYAVNQLVFASAAQSELYVASAALYGTRAYQLANATGVERQVYPYGPSPSSVARFQDNGLSLVVPCADAPMPEQRTCISQRAVDDLRGFVDLEPVFRRRREGGAGVAAFLTTTPLVDAHLPRPNAETFLYFESALTAEFTTHPPFSEPAVLHAATQSQLLRARALAHDVYVLSQGAEALAAAYLTSMVRVRESHPSTAGNTLSESLSVVVGRELYAGREETILERLQFLDTLLPGSNLTWTLLAPWGVPECALQRYSTQFRADATTLHVLMNHASTGSVHVSLAVPDRTQLVVVSPDTHTCRLVVDSPSASSHQTVLETYGRRLAAVCALEPNAHLIFKFVSQSSLVALSNLPTNATTHIYRRVTVPRASLPPQASEACPVTNLRTYASSEAACPPSDDLPSETVPAVLVDAPGLRLHAGDEQLICDVWHQGAPGSTVCSQRRMGVFQLDTHLPSSEQTRLLAVQTLFSSEAFLVVERLTMVDLADEEIPLGAEEGTDGCVADEIVVAECLIHPRVQRSTVRLALTCTAEDGGVCRGLFSFRDDVLADLTPTQRRRTRLEYHLQGVAAPLAVGMHARAGPNVYSDGTRTTVLGPAPATDNGVLDATRVSLGRYARTTGATTAASSLLTVTGAAFEAAATRMIVEAPTAARGSRLLDRVQGYYATGRVASVLLSNLSFPLVDLNDGDREVCIADTELFGVVMQEETGLFQTLSQPLGVASRCSACAPASEGDSTSLEERVLARLDDVAATALLEFVDAATSASVHVLVATAVRPGEGERAEVYWASQIQVLVEETFVDGVLVDVRGLPAAPARAFLAALRELAASYPGRRVYVESTDSDGDGAALDASSFAGLPLHPAALRTHHATLTSPFASLLQHGRPWISKYIQALPLLAYSTPRTPIVYTDVAGLGLDAAVGEAQDAMMDSARELALRSALAGDHLHIYQNCPTQMSFRKARKTVVEGEPLAAERGAYRRVYVAMNLRTSAVTLQPDWVSFEVDYSDATSSLERVLVSGCVQGCTAQLTAAGVHDMLLRPGGYVVYATTAHNASVWLETHSELDHVVPLKTYDAGRPSECVSSAALQDTDSQTTVEVESSTGLSRTAVILLAVFGVIFGILVIAGTVALIQWWCKPANTVAYSPL